MLFVRVCIVFVMKSPAKVIAASAVRWPPCNSVYEIAMFNTLESESALVVAPSNPCTRAQFFCCAPQPAVDDTECMQIVLFSHALDRVGVSLTAYEWLDLG